MLAVWISDPLISSSQGCPCCLHYLGFTIRQLYFQHLFPTLMLPLSSHSVWPYALNRVVLFILVGSGGRKGGRQGSKVCHVQSFSLSTSANPTSENDRESGRLQIISINVLKKWLCRVRRIYILTGTEAKGKRDKTNKSCPRVQQAGTEPPRRAAVTELSPATGQWQIGENSEDSNRSD